MDIFFYIVSLHIHKLTADMPGCFLHTRTIVTYPLLSICYIDQILILVIVFLFHYLIFLILCFIACYIQT